MDDWPFLGRQAVRDGLLTNYALSRQYRAIYRNVYVPNDTVMTASDRARAAWLWAGGEATLGGLSAAALLGTKWLDGDRPAELVRPDRHCPPGIVSHSWELSAGEVCVVRGIRVTTAARTAFDVGRTRGLTEAIPILDALMNATKLKPADVIAIADAWPGTRGVRLLRTTMDHVDGGAESPQESRLRMMIVDAGLPSPETQIEFRDRFGRVRIRVDIGWREWGVAVEYDGAHHWTDGRQRSWDIDRIALLEESGWVVVRVSADLLKRPDVVLQRIVAKLRAAGCPI
jgi:very-short-patch-repair endonuclease